MPSPAEFDQVLKKLFPDSKNHEEATKLAHLHILLHKSNSERALQMKVHHNIQSLVAAIESPDNAYELADGLFEQITDHGSKQALRIAGILMIAPSKIFSPRLTVDKITISSHAPSFLT